MSADVTEHSTSEALPSNAPFLPGNEEMHISPYPPKRTFPKEKRSEMALDYDEPAAKRSRRDSSQVSRRSRSPQPRSPKRDKPMYRERSRSRSRSRSDSRSQSRSSRSHSRHSRERYHQYSRSPEKNRSRRGSSIRERDGPRRDSRDSTPPFQRRRSSGGRGGGTRGPEPRDIRRKADISQEERKRGQRLFGGLFSNLGQPAGRGRPGLGASDARDGRMPIDRRHDRSLQTEEDRQKVAERLAKFDRMRKIEQVKLDEMKMKTMHVNELVIAQSLCTTTKPVLYYRPRNLTEVQEQIIEDQVRSAKRRIEQEKNDFEKQKQTRLAALGVQYTPKTAAPEAPGPDASEDAVNTDRPKQPSNENKDEQEDTDMAPPSPQPNADAMVDEPAGNIQAEETRSSLPVVEDRAGHDLRDDKDKGIMVEHEEDTVIY
ncbi:hypothetical protein SEUCBS140593_000306 [Sporothrix eucalyptigena]|uniref:Pinin/SDK/MemA protein domain-containing protein n=1 Tax=Sporothrix eucalyptigena TaxID=1812306 RepID=A0ABP0ANS3_9PEZI